MRRYLFLIAATGTLLMGCSSSNETSTPSSTTSSSVVVTPANKAACDDLAKFNDGLLNSGFKAGATPGETAAEVQKLFNAVLPSLETLKASAPADLSPAIDVYVVRFNEAKTLDPTASADQQKLTAMLMAPDAELKQAQATLTSWSSKNCGIDLPGS